MRGRDKNYSGKCKSFQVDALGGSKWHKELGIHLQVTEQEVVGKSCVLACSPSFQSLLTVVWWLLKIICVRDAPANTAECGFFVLCGGRIAVHEQLRQGAGTTHVLEDIAF